VSHIYISEDCRLAYIGYRATDLVVVDLTQNSTVLSVQRFEYINNFSIVNGDLFVFEVKQVQKYYG
jgi:hypothetical protein